MRNLNIALMVAAALTLGLATAPVANAQGAGKTMTMSDKKPMTKSSMRAEREAKEREQTKKLNEAQLKK
jgi:Ni/Co efflux regulator RcnB